MTVERQGPRPRVSVAVEKQGARAEEQASAREEVGPSKRLAIVVTDNEMAWFRALADAEGMTVSGWVRMTMRKAYSRLVAKRARAAVKRRLRA